MTTSTLMTAVTNTRSFQYQETKRALKRTFIEENAFLILLHGCSLVKDFNNFTRNFQLLNTWRETFDSQKPSNQLSLSDSEKKK